MSVNIENMKALIQHLEMIEALTDGRSFNMRYYLLCDDHMSPQATNYPLLFWMLRNAWKKPSECMASGCIRSHAAALAMETAHYAIPITSERWLGLEPWQGYRLGRSLWGPKHHKLSMIGPSDNHNATLEKAIIELERIVECSEKGVDFYDYAENRDGRI